MNGADEVAEHIHASLLDLRRKLDPDVVMDVARAVMNGAAQALNDLADTRSNPRADAPERAPSYDLNVTQEIDLDGDARPPLKH